ncbi:non-homologous end-joining factor 1-like isoform X2 [Ceratina calcarata]|uniref:Non-homologous end-joining factor 1 n=1 Tax=Ceratina calcarata TaxID=156304 RepID=A0AAJ7NDQ7_9HYME|nr:non-homologous end-joining factor 1-like isoform X2 [Ceratina calcarata]
MWESVKIDSKDYLISVTRNDDTIKIFLTDLIELWTETLTNEIVLNKCRKLNPLLNVEALNYNEIVLNVLRNISNYIVEASVELIKLRVPIEGGSMKFNLSLTKSTSQDFWEIVTKPFCISGMELMRQRTILLDLIKKKDEEIEEYKAQGAELIRKNIETKLFVEEQLKADIPNPDTVDCTNAFRGIMNFHNESNSCKPSLMASIDETGKTETRVIITPEEGVIKIENTSEQGNAESTNVDNKEQSKAEVKKKVAKSKTGTANLRYKPPKKLKKGLNNFIL